MESVTCRSSWYMKKGISKLTEIFLRKLINGLIGHFLDEALQPLVDIHLSVLQRFEQKVATTSERRQDNDLRDVSQLDGYSDGLLTVSRYQ